MDRLILSFFTSMKIYKALQIGDFHLNNCEDYLYSGEIGSNKCLCAVMDGCTMGIDSYFVSTLVGKLLRKIAKEKGYKEMYEYDSSLEDIDKYLRSILSDLFKELKIIQNQLMLEFKEMPTTLIILLIDTQKNEGIVLVIGDGLVSINGSITEFDQDNKPDYLGFHLNENFETWYENQPQKIKITNVEDISIATDGIFMFSEVAKKVSNEHIDAIKFLVLNKEYSENEEMLNVKLKKLESEFGLKPTDDLAIIRILK